MTPPAPMTRLSTLFVLLFAAVPVLAQEDEPPFPEYPAFRPGTSVMGDQNWYSLTLLDELELAPAAAGVPAALEGFFRTGTDYHRLYLKAEGEGLLSEGAGEGEVQALYSRIITSYFEAQAGVRLDTEFGEGDVRARPLLVVGMEGLAPYWFEVEPAVFLSAEGHLSARFEGSYDLLITQRLVAEPDVEVNVALQEVEEWGVGAGLNDVELGLRLRYEIRREVAPYVGISWTNRFGAAADFAEAAGEEASEVLFLVGLRVWH